ncbi:endospore germination permease [Paenibacillus turicensis]|uniref:GerAB/ArcD/ProY family transporter n=1 Tax=Paenibacillus turicensis TaxID=160487 RepID=UPI003D2C6527
MEKRELNDMLTDQGKISANQLAFLVFPTIIATAILSVPSITMRYAGHDMWLSPIIGSLFGLATIGLSIGLHRLYPGKTLIQASPYICGKWIGKIVSFLFLWFFPHLTGLVIRQYGEFITSTALPATPLYVVMGTMVIVCALNVRLGIEVVGRTSQVFVTLVVILFCGICLLLIGELDPAEILPFMERGVLPSIKGAIAPAAWFSEYIIIAFLIPNVNQKQGLTRSMLISLLVTTIAMIASNLFCLFLMGDLTDSFAYPFMIATRYITIADFLQHIEAVVIAIWIFGIFVKISVFLYIFATSVAEWLGMEDYKPVVFPLSFLCLVFAYWVVSDQSSAASLLSSSANIYTLAFLLFIPAMLYVVALLKRLFQGWSKGSEPS